MQNTDTPISPGPSQRNKRVRSLESIRRKRIRRNKAKREALRKISTKNRLSKFTRREACKLKNQIQDIEAGYKKEKRLSAFLWSRWQSLETKHRSQIRIPRQINRDSLKDTHGSQVLGKGSFGFCKKMSYRHFSVAVKYFADHVKSKSALREASIINTFDHPGIPFFFGFCIEQRPYIMITQFHGVDGNCVTMNWAARQALFSNKNEWVKIFKETAETLLYVHSGNYLHNDIKGDNVIITENNGLHPILIDFGKACTISNGKLYKLTVREKERYNRHHWHIAPELIRGTHSQSIFSDIYSFGMLIHVVCKFIPNSKCLEFIATKCLHSGPSKRPSLEHVLDHLTEQV